MMMQHFSSSLHQKLSFVMEKTFHNPYKVFLHNMYKDLAIQIQDLVPFENIYINNTLPYKVAHKGINWQTHSHLSIYINCAHGHLSPISQQSDPSKSTNNSQLLGMSSSTDPAADNAQRHCLLPSAKDCSLLGFMCCNSFHLSSILFFDAT